MLDSENEAEKIASTFHKLCNVILNSRNMNWRGIRYKQILVLLLVALVPLITASLYVEHQRVPVWFSTVGPYQNRYETYSYTRLPYCPQQNERVVRKPETLGEALQGMELIESGMDVKFLGILIL